MMLVSSSGWAHSPITLIFTALSAVYGAAFAPGTAAKNDRRAPQGPRRNVSSPLILAPLRTTSNSLRPYVIPGFRRVSSSRATTLINRENARRRRHLGRPARRARERVRRARCCASKLTRDSVRYGARTGSRARCWTARHRVAGQEVVLEGRRYPVRGLRPRDRAHDHRRRGRVHAPAPNSTATTACASPRPP